MTLAGESLMSVQAILYRTAREINEKLFHHQHGMLLSLVGGWDRHITEL